MSDRLTIDADTRAVLAALDRVGEAARPHLRAASRATAERVRDEARGRVARRSGKTASAIEVEELNVVSDLDGYAVVAGRPKGGWQNLPLGLERGTKHMEARPFFDSSGRLEEGPHRVRIIGAINDTLAELGLGE